MTGTVAVFLVFAGLVVAYGIADEVAKRKNRRASEALNQRHRVGL